MCLSETSIVAICCCAITAIASIVTTALSLRNRSKEKYKIKQDAILSALRFLDTYYSYLDYSSGITPIRKPYDSVKMTLECRDCYEKLSVSVNDRSILEEFLSIVLDKSTNVLCSFNAFRNLSRKELGLKEIQYNKDSIFLSVITTETLGHTETKE